MRCIAVVTSLALLITGRACTGGADDASESAGKPRKEAAVKPPKKSEPKDEPRVDVGATSGAVSEREFKALHELRTDAAPPLQGSSVDLAGGKAYLSLPDGQPKAGIVVIQEWWGLNDHIKHWTDRLAGLGYAALAVDLYEGKVATTPDQAGALMKQVDPARATEIVKAGHRFLVDDPRIKAARTGSIGWCFGGHWSLRLAMAEPELDACVMYYGRPVLEPESLKPIRAAVLGVFGSKDASIPTETVEQLDAALTTAGVRHQVLLFPAEHAFANPSNARYDQVQAAKAWERTRAFLDEHLRSAPR